MWYVRDPWCWWSAEGCFVPVPHGSTFWWCSLARCCTIICLWNNPVIYLWTVAGLRHDQRESFVIVTKFESVFCASLIFITWSLIACRGLSRRRHRSVVVSRDESERCDNKWFYRSASDRRASPGLKVILCAILMPFPPTLWSNMDSLPSEVFFCFLPCCGGAVLQVQSRLSVQQGHL